MSETAAARERWTCAGIVAAALLLRIVGLGRVPPGLFVDEAYTGYDALSLLHTARDFSGKLLPLYFPAWGGDAVEGLYRYLCVPFVALLGPTSVAVRLPAALAGAATVAGTYLLGRRLLGARAGLVAAALLALSPWHLQFSRVGFRGILVPLAAVWMAWLAAAAAGIGPPGTRPRPRLWLGAAAVAGLGIYTYSVAKLFVPAFAVLTGWVLRRRLPSRPAQAAGAVALLVALAVPAAWVTLSGEGQVRFREISIFRAEALDEAGERLRRDHPDLPGVAAVAGSRVLTGSWLFASNYLSHFSPSFLALGGDRNLRHSPPGVGQLHIVELLLVLAGLVVAVRRRGEADLWLVGWLLLGALGDSLTADRIPNALRSMAMLPAPQLLAGSGAVALFAALSRRRAVTALAALLLVGGAVEVSRHLEAYFRRYAAASAPWWNAGYSEGIRLLAREAPAGVPLVVARPERWRAERYALNPVLHSLVLAHAGPPPREFQAGAGIGMFEVVRIPEEGLLGRDMFPAGAWVLLPADRVRPADVHLWVPGRGAAGNRRPGGDRRGLSFGLLSARICS